MRRYLQIVGKKASTPPAIIFFVLTGVMCAALWTINPGLAVGVFILFVATRVLAGIGLRRIPQVVRGVLESIRGTHSFGPAGFAPLYRGQTAARAQPEPADRETAEPLLVLTRILGNDLEPRHAKGQTFVNLTFILDHEPDLPGVRKHWIVNRIVDDEEEKRLIDLLESHAQSYTRIPFDGDDYLRQGWDSDALPTPDYLTSGQADRLDEHQRRRLLLALHRPRNRYLMNNNGARNVALEYGRARAKWSAAWDGNCFVNASSWEKIRHDLEQFPGVPVRVVPMERVTNSAELIGGAGPTNAYEEPQLILHRDLHETFNEEFVYGTRPKVEMFWRLGIPGPWTRWPDEPWDVPRRQPLDEPAPYRVAGWVYRLSSGQSALDRPTEASFQARGRQREVAILATLRSAHRRVEPPGAGAGLYNRSLLDSVKRDQVTPSPFDHTHLPGRLFSVLDNIQHTTHRQDSSSTIVDIVGLALHSRVDGDADSRDHALTHAAHWCDRVSVDSFFDGGDGSAGNRLHRAQFPAFSDALDLLRTGESSSDERWSTISRWYAEYRDWLASQTHAGVLREQAATVGIWQDLHRAAVEKFLGDVDACELSVFRGLSRLRETGDSANEDLVNVLPRVYLCAFAVRHGMALGPATAPSVAPLVRALSDITHRAHGSHEEDTDLIDAIIHLAGVAGLSEGADGPTNLARHSVIPFIECV